MPNHILNVYLEHTQGQLKLRFIEESPVALETIFEEAWRYAHDKLNLDYVDYSANNITTPPPLATYENDANFQMHNELTIPLSNNPEKLWRQIGPLDGALHYYLKKNHLTKDDFAAYTITVQPDKVLEVEVEPRTLSRAVTALIAAHIDANFDELPAYEAAASTFAELLASKEDALMPAIRAKYFPVAPLPGITTQFLIKNPIMQDVFDPATDASTKEKLVVDYLQRQLSKRNAPPSSSPAWTLFGFAEPTEMDAEKFIDNIAVLQQMLWYQTVESLIGKTGYNGGAIISGKTNPEFSFLFNDTTLFLNDDDLMELTSSPLNFMGITQTYDSKKNALVNRDDFEHELRHAAKLLGLEFVPEQDFYNTRKFVFDRASTRKLMDWGFHLTRRYCVNLLKNSNGIHLLDTDVAPLSPSELTRDDIAAESAMPLSMVQFKLNELLQMQPMRYFSDFRTLLDKLIHARQENKDVTTFVNQTIPHYLAANTMAVFRRLGNVNVDESIDKQLPIFYRQYDTYEEYEAALEPSAGNPASCELTERLNALQAILNVMREEDDFFLYAFGLSNMPNVEAAARTFRQDYLDPMLLSITRYHNAVSDEAKIREYMNAGRDLQKLVTRIHDLGAKVYGKELFDVMPAMTMETFEPRVQPRARLG